VSVLSFSGYGMGGLHAVKPLDWISKYPIELEKKELEIIDEVAAPVLCLSKPPIRGPLKWRCMHEFEDGQSLVLPLCMNDPTQAARVTMDWNLIDWEAIHGLQRDKINCHEFGQVAHLPNWTMGN